jgi:hypothetical protein
LSLGRCVAGEKHHFIGSRDTRLTYYHTRQGIRKTRRHDNAHKSPSKLESNSQQLFNITSSHHHQGTRPTKDLHLDLASLGTLSIVASPVRVLHIRDLKLLVTVGAADAQDRAHADTVLFLAVDAVDAGGAVAAAVVAGKALVQCSRDDGVYWDEDGTHSDFSAVPL